MKKSRVKHSPAFKAKVALEAIRETQTIAELAQKHQVHVSVISKWKKALQDGATQVFETGIQSDESSAKTDALLKKIGELSVEKDFLEQGLRR